MVPDYNDKRSAYGPRRFGTITIDNIGIELLVKIMSVHPMAYETSSKWHLVHQKGFPRTNCRRKCDL